MYVKFLEGRSLANEKLENEVAREFWMVSNIRAYLPFNNFQSIIFSIVNILHKFEPPVTA